MQALRKSWLFPLRSVETQGEAALADTEIRILLGGDSRHGKPPRDLLKSLGATTLEDDSRAFVASLRLDDVRRVAKRVAYGRLLIVEGHVGEALPSLLLRSFEMRGKTFTAILPYQRLFEATALTKHSAFSSNYLPMVADEAWSRALGSLGVAAPTSPASRKKNEYLAHGLHKYKAKFFPRLARALINISVGDRRRPVLDPMAGSGTTLFEASLMGLPSIGYDIDPLAALIGGVKARSLRFADLNFNALLAGLNTSGKGTRQLGLFAQQAAAHHMALPNFIAKKIPPALARDIEGEWSTLMQHVAACATPELREVARVALSHAISTKVSLRWMGTGDNRFAISVSPRTLGTVFHRQLRLLSERVATFRQLSMAGFLDVSPHTQYEVADARKLPLKAGSVSGIVTSPPYLPAASGRETYLRSRAPALVLLGLLSEEEILNTEEQMLGTIMRDGNLSTTTLPTEVVDLVRWMQPQRARGPKALPTLNYFESLKDVLGEISRVLEPSGKCAMVLSARHQFYELTTRHIVRTFEMAETVAKLASQPKYGARLRVCDVLEIELPKMDYLARPASKLAYAECILILESRD